MVKIILVLTIPIFLLILLSCAAQPEDNQIIPQKQSSALETREPWQVKWDNLIQGARKEGKVVVYGAATGDIREVLIKAFYDKFGIPVEYMSAKGPEIAAKIIAERNARLYIPDVIIGASSPSINILKPMGFFDPMEPVLILPEVIDPKSWWENRVPWVDNEQKYFIGFLAYISPRITINTDFVISEDIKQYRDLLASKWKGKIAMFDPTIAGAGQSLIAIVVYYTPLGTDYLRNLAQQEPFISRDHRLLAEWVARGKYSIGLSIESEAVRQMQSAGLTNLQNIYVNEDIAVSSGSGFLSLPKNAPHPNAGALFSNWLLSREGQSVYQDIAGLQSARNDIPTAKLEPLFTRKPGVKYSVNYASEEYQLKSSEYNRLGREFFGHLIR